MAPVAVGNKIPDTTLMYLDDDYQSQKFNLHEKLKGRKAVVIGVPGAFTPTWSQKHIPSLIKLSEEIKSTGVSDIIVISVNDQYVMKSWERSFDGGEHLKFLADGSAEFTNALDLELDLTEKGMGKRSRQYSLFVNDLVVEAVNLDEGGLFADFEESQVRPWGAVKVVNLDEGGQIGDFEEGGQPDWQSPKFEVRRQSYIEAEEERRRNRANTFADCNYLLGFIVLELDHPWWRRAENVESVDQSGLFD